MLIPVNLRCNLKYASWKLPGAISNAWLEQECLSRLHAANDLIIKETSGEIELLVWDALRSFETQSFLFDCEIQKAAKANPRLSAQEVADLVSAYVRPPSHLQPPPHTTGGAVDVTLWANGSDQLLGQFDDFSPKGRSDYFDNNVAMDPPAKEQEFLRGLLARAMKAAGFAGIPEEWWHWEYGTRHWASETGNQALFTSVQTPPSQDTISARLPGLPSRNFVNVHGVAQVFQSAQDRNDALAGLSSGHYYARTRHHNEQQASTKLASSVSAEDAVCLPSGLSAAIAAVGSKAHRGRSVVVDAGAYYETISSLMEIGAIEGWQVNIVDLSHPGAIDTIREICPAVIFVDHPRNWHLTCPALETIKSVADEIDATVIVDVSVQPLQKGLIGRLAHLLVISLSKYPSMGETMGGMVLGASKDLTDVRRYARLRGLLLAPEAAATIAVGLTSMQDRIAACSSKAQRVVQFLRTQPEVMKVRFPDLSHVGALPGGQLVVVFHDPAFASSLEAVVGWNSGSPVFPLVLACTFGASFTTFENFFTRDQIALPPERLPYSIDNSMVRISLGGEDVMTVIDSLKFMFSVVRSNIEDLCETSHSLQSAQ